MPDTQEQHRGHTIREHPFFGHLCVDCQRRVADYKEPEIKESPFTRRARENKLPPKELGR